MGGDGGIRGRVRLYPLFQKHHCHRRRWHEHSARGHRCKLQGFLHLLQQKERPMMQCGWKQWQPLQERERESEGVGWLYWFEGEWKVRREGGYLWSEAKQGVRWIRSWTCRCSSFWTNYYHLSNLLLSLCLFLYGILFYGTFLQ